MHLESRSGSPLVYHKPPPPTAITSAAEARDTLVEHVLDPRSGACRVCNVPGPCPAADAAIATLARLGVRLPSMVEPVPLDGPTMVLPTVPPPRHLVAPERPPELPRHRTGPPPGVDPLDWALAVRLRWDHRTDESGACHTCGTRYWCRGRWLAERVIGNRSPLARPVSPPADRLHLSVPGSRPRRVPGKAGRDYFAQPPYWGAPGWFGDAA